MARRSSRTVWLGKVSFIDRHPGQLSLVADNFAETLAKALDPDKRIKYYREWRLSEPHLDHATGTLSAQLGFRRPTRQEEVDYDEEKHAWVSSEAPARHGNYAHFIVDLASQLIAFEDRGTDLNRDAFVAALGRFLETARLEVNLISDTAEFDAWLDQIDRVTRFRVTLRVPNPGFSKRAKEVRELVMETQAERITIEAQSDDGLNVRDTLLDGAADTAALGNGSFKATGFAGKSRRFFDSARRFLSGTIEVSAQDSSATITNKITDLMREIAPPLPEHDNDTPNGS
jgi:hypothetical protein